MTHDEGLGEMQVLLVGSDAALLEGLAQSFAAVGYATNVTASLHEAREAAMSLAPLLAVVDGELAFDANADTLAIALAPGGALVLYHGAAELRPAISPTLQRSVMADLSLPLERNRLMALAQHVQERARATGRGKRNTPPEQQAF
jgi:ActR/RegA family two-component response regulator